MARGKKATTTNALVESLIYFADHAGLATAKELRLNCPSVAKMRGTVPSGVKVMRILVRRKWVERKIKPGTRGKYTMARSGMKAAGTPYYRKGSVMYKLTNEGMAAIKILRAGNEDAIMRLLMGAE